MLLLSALLSYKLPHKQVVVVVVVGFVAVAAG
jgi:hypothetical protein